MPVWIVVLLGLLALSLAKNAGAEVYIQLIEATRLKFLYLWSTLVRETSFEPWLRFTNAYIHTCLPAAYVSKIAFETASLGIFADAGYVAYEVHSNVAGTDRTLISSVQFAANQCTVMDGFSFMLRVRGGKQIISFS